MDINDIRIAWTLASAAVFLAIVAWAWSRGAQRGFDEAARLPFADDARTAGAGAAAREERA